MTHSDYQQFVEAKICLDRGHGFSIDPDDIRPLNDPDEWKPHEVDVIRWALRGGRRAIFASFGLGKTLMQIEILRQIGQALTRFFQRDSSKANKLTLYPHKEKEFWLWVSSWAIFLQKPSDLGYSDEGYDLPPLHVHWHCVKTDPKQVVERDGQVRMYSDAAMSLRDAAREKRDTLDLRIEKMVEILDGDSDHWIIWHDLEAERHAIKQALPEAVEVYGSLDLDEREDRRTMPTLFDFETEAV